MSIRFAKSISSSVSSILPLALFSSNSYNTSITFIFHLSRLFYLMIIWFTNTSTKLLTGKRDVYDIRLGFVFVSREEPGILLTNFVRLPTFFGSTFAFSVLLWNDIEPYIDHQLHLLWNDHFSPYNLKFTYLLLLYLILAVSSELLLVMFFSVFPSTIVPILLILSAMAWSDIASKLSKSLSPKNISSISCWSSLIEFISSSVNSYSSYPSNEFEAYILYICILYERNF